jgi:hypothetical protein
MYGVRSMESHGDMTASRKSIETPSDERGEFSFDARTTRLEFIHRPENCQFLSLSVFCRPLSWVKCKSSAPPCPQDWCSARSILFWSVFGLLATHDTHQPRRFSIPPSDHQADETDSHKVLTRRSRAVGIFGSPAPFQNENA